MDTRPSCSGRKCTPPTPQEVRTSELTLVGKITTETEFTQSLWGDEHLYFQHGEFEADGERQGGDMAFLKDILEFQDPFGLYPREIYSPPSIDDEGVLDGLVNHNGCPFQWIIDSIPRS